MAARVVTSPVGCVPAGSGAITDAKWLDSFRHGAVYPTAMTMQAYEAILASLDRAITMLDQQTDRRDVERDALEKLREIRMRVAEAQNGMAKQKD